VIGRRRIYAFAALAAVCLLAAIITATVAIIGTSNARQNTQRIVEAARPQASRVMSAGTPFAVLRRVDRSSPSNYGRLAVASVTGTKVGQAVLAGPACHRVAFDAGKGLCLDVLGTQMGVAVLNSRLEITHSIQLAGIPSRARISPDGRWGGVTAFIVGHAYAAPGRFSTAATIIDMKSGKAIANLEHDFTVTNDGKVVDERDRNYWGITFADDGDTFYATLATGSKTWLIEGSIKARRAHTIHDNVECPSLSPDGTRIAYKKAVGHDPTVWRFTVLNLATGRETPLAETRSIDDQPAWLDNGHLLYGDTSAEDTWMVDADGTGTPRRWMTGADSVTVNAGSPRR
jgi:hypothetical protein